MSQNNSTQYIELIDNSNGKFSLFGMLSFSTVMKVYKKSIPLFRKEKKLLVDLKGVRYSDSAGLALLLEWLAEANKKGQEIQFINMSKQLQAMAILSDLEDIIPQDKVAR